MESREVPARMCSYLFTRQGSLLMSSKEFKLDESTIHWQGQDSPYTGHDYAKPYVESALNSTGRANNSSVRMNLWLFAYAELATSIDFTKTLCFIGIVAKISAPSYLRHVMKN